MANETMSINETPIRQRKEKSVKERLAAEKKVTIRLPKPKSSHETNYVPVCIDGYIIKVMRGVDVEVPVTVKGMLLEAGYFD